MVAALPPDVPIAVAEDDRLGRAVSARSFAGDILALNVESGAVVGVLGPWGSGKTSFVNMVREALSAEANLDVLDFNPWMFSGASQLVETFFIEISAQLRIKDPNRFKRLADELQRYGEVLAPLSGLPFVGVWIGRYRSVASYLKRNAQDRERGVSELRTAITERLSSLDKPIVVVLDDLDRLDNDEVRDVFKLVRLTASFRNIVYVLCFDRVRVEAALSEDGIDGQDYLEKILQLTLDLPSVSRAQLARELLSAVQAALTGTEAAPLDDDGLIDIVAEVVLPLVSNVRDVRRYALSVQAIARMTAPNINVADLLALEAVRMFMPAVYRLMEVSQDSLTATREALGREDAQEAARAAQVSALFDAAASDRGVVEALVRRVFPAAQRHMGGAQYGSDWRKQWIRDRRAAHPIVLDYYFTKVLSDGFKHFILAEHVVDGMRNPGVFRDRFEGVHREDLQDVISAMENFEGEYPPEGVKEAVGVLLGLSDDMPERRSEFGDLGPRFAVSRVVLRLLRRLEGETAIVEVVREVLAQLTTLSSRLDLVSMVGHEENVGQGLVSEADADVLNRQLRNEIRDAPPESLAAERELARLLYWERRGDDPDGDRFDPVTQPPPVALAILRAFIGTVRGQTVGNRAVRVERSLSWDGLIDYLGGEDQVRQLYTTARECETADEAAQSDLELVRRYPDGWRPESW